MNPKARPTCELPWHIVAGIVDEVIEGYHAEGTVVKCDQCHTACWALTTVELAKQHGGGILGVCVWNAM